MTESFIRRIEQEIADLPLPQDLPELYDPISYTLALGGKRIRPLLLLLSAKLFNNQPEIPINQALGIEIFHNFTLIHDDVMDNAPIRRGEPTVFKKWNQNIAILSGDVTFALAVKYISNCDEKHLKKILEVFLQTAVEVCEGQQMDMNFETRDNVTMAEYMKMIDYKTARLIAGGMKIGAITGDCTEKDAEKVFNYGLAIGKAFQLMDDYLDAFGTSYKFGKRQGGDILSGKKTFLYIRTNEKASPEDRKTLDQLYNGTAMADDEKVEKVKAFYIRYGVDQMLKQEVANLMSESEELLATISGDTETKEELIILTQQLTKREI